MRLGDVIFSELKSDIFAVFLENDKTNLRQIFLQDLGQNTSLQPALKNTAPGLYGILRGYCKTKQK